jgi:hypothetical protein
MRNFTLLGFLIFAAGGAFSQTFSPSAALVSEFANMDQVCQSEFGPQSACADWTEVELIPNIVAWADSIGLQLNEQWWVKNNGVDFWSGNRHYFLARHNNEVPGGWLVHDNILNNFIDLGSFYGFLQPVLCKNVIQPSQEGCTDPQACEYNPSALIDDGSCATWPGDACDDGNPESFGDVIGADCLCTGTIEGCTDPNSCQYDPEANVDDGSCITQLLDIPVFSPTSQSFLETEDLPQRCKDEFGDHYELGDWTDLEQVADIQNWADSIGFDYMDQWWLQSGDQRFWSGNRHYLMQRHNGVTPGNWLVHDNISNNFIDLGSFYGYVQPALCATRCPVRSGCMDVLACNYDPLATLDDGSCAGYPGDICDDGNPLTSNDVLDGNCECTGVLAPGCMYPAACNYDPSALTDDGSCEFVSCAGCTYPDAVNYNAAATIDDGSCLYFDACPYDLNEDGLINTADLLVLLSAFGGVCD